MGCSGALSKGVSQDSSFWVASEGEPRRVPFLPRGAISEDQLLAAEVEGMSEESGGVKSGSKKPIIYFGVDERALKVIRRDASSPP